ncbi:kinase-associated protein B [Paenibacillus cellulosilyticus]|uniref:Kinase-associated protein B n=1 Tax=Paenibacillus cellulosilyticus TaxID=375489 RepID=A0A2V2YXL6_9BACL|nr:sporulation phosphorelay system protein KapB [Paenibacillus cellulosilyticus]PWV97353.1 kinase-associated protein B [Paenibacillus cellulosilyticus]QKS47450.1 kinase [Paenibacillus cellulosilyticus]
MRYSQQNQPEKDQIVRMTYKTGVYAGTVFETGGPRAVVQVMAVLKHPQQGNLHYPYDPDVPMFHERKALSHNEKALVAYQDIEPFHGEVPDYQASLVRALEEEAAELDRLKRWAERGLETLAIVKKDYGM